MQFYATSASAAPDWLRQATVAAFTASADISDGELADQLDQAVFENISVLEIDTRLSEYLSDEEFAIEVEFIDRIANGALARGMHSVIYYPAFEVITEDGVNSSSSMFKDNPDWVQRGIDGTPNVFYGNQEVWVDENAESAWMSPNSPYRDYFINRVEQLATTAVNGLWLDVPIYLDTGTGWAGAESGAAEDFNAWTIAEGLGGPSGFTVPEEVDMDDPVFRAWVRWRQINISTFIEDVRLAVAGVDADKLVLVENFPMDYMDGTTAGLDGALLKKHPNVVQVLELDSVSNTSAMQWSNTDDFENKITMLKWGMGIDGSQPNLSFSYGNEALDAGLTMAAVVATGSTPFEAKTPDMTTSVGVDFRRNWFGFVRNNADELLMAQRRADIGIWYSGSSRDYVDFPVGGHYGMFTDYTPPVNDPDWWSTYADDSAARKPHLGGYRGIAAALTRLNTPFTVVNEARVDSARLEEIELLFLPSVEVVSTQDAALITAFANAGGTVIATGRTPAVLDELGDRRSSSALDNLFAFDGRLNPDATEQVFGEGLAIYRPDVAGWNMFGQTDDPVATRQTLASIAALLGSHTDSWLEVDGVGNIYIEAGITDAATHHLYIVNYSGLQQPLVSNPQTVNLSYRPEQGRSVTSAFAVSPDDAAQKGSISVTDAGDGSYQLRALVDQFSMINLTLSDGDEEPLEIVQMPQPEEVEELPEIETVTALAEAIAVDTGNVDYGTLDSLTSTDSETYDIDSSPVLDGHRTDWQISTQFEERDNFAGLTVVFSGHYSVSGVDQRVYLFNHADADWLQFDRRTINGGDDILITLAPENASDYVSPAGEVILRVRGDRAGGSFTSWANAVSFSLRRSQPDVDETSVDNVEESVEESTDENVDETLVDAPDEVDPSIDNEGISNPAQGITLDGELSEWSEYRGFAEDPDDVAGANDPLDWLRAFMAHSDDTLYLAYENDGSVAASWGQTVYMDTDQDAQTGFGNGLPIGADYVLQSNFLYRYKGSGNDWNWEFLEQVQHGRSQQQFEFSWPLAQMADPLAINVAFVGANEAYSRGRIEDLYPDGVYDTSSESRFFTYTLGEQANNAPVSSAREYVTQINEAIVVELDASDLDGDALTFTVVDQADLGELSGTAPLLTYTPNENVVGQDRFSFVANDGEFDSGEALVAIRILADDDLSPPSNPSNAIVLDGNAEDWAGLRQFDVDPADITGEDNPLDYRRAAMAHSGANLYILFEIDQREVASIAEWAFNIYLDTDNQQQTGYAAGLSIGADYLQQGSSLFRYSGNGSSWSWEFVASLQRVSNLNVAELAIPRSSLGNPQSLSLLFIGDNLSINGSLEDLYPDGVYDERSATRFFEYDATTVIEGNSEPLFGLALGAIEADQQPENGRVDLFANARQPKSARPVSKSGGSGALSVFAVVFFLLLLAFVGFKANVLPPRRYRSI